jgi:hypothetical protein
MNGIKLRIAFLLLLTACTSSSKRSFEETVPPEETGCLEKIDRAKEDLRNGKWVFCDSSDFYDSPIKYRASRERRELLKKHGVTLEFAGVYKYEYVFAGELDYEVNCYCAYMREKIDEKFGSHFIDSIAEAAEELMLYNHIDTSFFDDFLCDVWPVYPGDTESHDELSPAFSADLKSLLLRSTGKFNSTVLDNQGYIDIDIQVDRNGNVKVDSYLFILTDQSKRKYEAYLRRQITGVVKKTGWIPGEVRGRKVNSVRDIRFFFDYRGLEESEEMKPVPPGTLIHYIG